MQHETPEAICELPFPALQYLDHRSGQIVKSQTRRHSADVLKHPLQAIQQALLVL